MLVLGVQGSGFSFSLDEFWQVDALKGSQKCFIVLQRAKNQCFYFLDPYRGLPSMKGLLFTSTHSSLLSKYRTYEPIL